MSDAQDPKSRSLSAWRAAAVQEPKDQTRDVPAVPHVVDHPNPNDAATLKESLPPALVAELRRSRAPFPPRMQSGTSTLPLTAALSPAPPTSPSQAPVAPHAPQPRVESRPSEQRSFPAAAYDDPPPTLPLTPAHAMLKRLVTESSIRWATLGIAAAACVVLTVHGLAHRAAPSPTTTSTRVTASTPVAPREAVAPSALFSDAAALPTITSGDQVAPSAPGGEVAATPPRPSTSAPGAVVITTPHRPTARPPTSRGNAFGMEQARLLVDEAEQGLLRPGTAGAATRMASAIQRVTNLGDSGLACRLTGILRRYAARPCSWQDATVVPRIRAIVPALNRTCTDAASRVELAQLSRCLRTTP